MDTALTKSEQNELARLCKVVDEGLTSFLAVGTALKQISEGKLYRETHETFEEFVKQRWNIQRAHAYRMMDAAEVNEDLSPNGRRFPIVNEIKTERQLRELKGLGGESIPEALEKITEVCEESGKKPTAKIIKSVVDEMLGKSEPKPVKPEPVRSKADQFEKRCRRILGDHANGMRLQLSNLGYSDEFESFLNRIDEIVKNG